MDEMEMRIWSATYAAEYVTGLREISSPISELGRRPALVAEQAIVDYRDAMRRNEFVSSLYYNKVRINENLTTEEIY